MTSPSADPTPRTTSFELVLPPDPELLRVVRLVASGLASFTRLDLDTVEAVRVGADELVSTLVQSSADADVTVRFAIDGPTLSISGRTTLAAADSFELDPLTDRILDEVTTSHEFSRDGEQLSGRIEVALPS